MNKYKSKFRYQHAINFEKIKTETITAINLSRAVLELKVKYKKMRVVSYTETEAVSKQKNLF